MMKKLLFITTAFLTTAVGVNAQTYGFTKTTATYSDLTNATSLNNGQVWDDPDLSISTGFSYQLYGNAYDSLYLGFGVGGTYSTSRLFFSSPFPAIFMTTADLIDRGYDSPNQVSVSPISYKVEGTAGSRIFKLEFKNAGFYEDLNANQGVSTDYINMQLWLFENSGNIEYHFGPNSVTQPLLVYDTTGPAHGLSSNIDVFNFQISKNSIFLEGAANNPTAFQDSAFRVVNGTPPNGTVYRFINGGTVSVDELIQSNQINLSIYPNPTTKVVSMNIDQSDLISHTVSIYNVNGQLVSIKEYQSQIDVSELNNGTYFMEVITKDGRGVSKFIKQ